MAWHYEDYSLKLRPNMWQSKTSSNQSDKYFSFILSNKFQNLTILRIDIRSMVDLSWYRTSIKHFDLELKIHSI